MAARLVTRDRPQGALHMGGGRQDIFTSVEQDPLPHVPRHLLARDAPDAAFLPDHLDFGAFRREPEDMDGDEIAAEQRPAPPPDAAPAAAPPPPGTAGCEVVSPVGFRSSGGKDPGGSTGGMGDNATMTYCSKDTIVRLKEALLYAYH